MALDIRLVADDKKFVYYHGTGKTTYNDLNTLATNEEVFTATKALGKLMSRPYKKLAILQESKLYDASDPNYVNQ